MKNNKGFTLIELLVVVLIIGILAAIALPQYFKAVEKSRTAEANTMLGAINHAQAEYSMSQSSGAYTDNFNNLVIDKPGNCTLQTTTTTNDTLRCPFFKYTLTSTTATAQRYNVVNNADSPVSGYTLTLTYDTSAINCGTAAPAGACLNS